MMKHHRFPFRPFAVVLAVAALWGSAVAQITATPHGYRLRAKYVKGDLRRYKMPSTVATGGETYALAAPFTMTVLSVQKGVGNIRYAAGPVYSKGKAIGKKDVFEASLDSRGQAVKGPATIQQFGQVSFPEQPIRVGHSWTTSVDAAVGTMPIHVDGQFKLAGFRTIKGRRVAWITTRIKNSKSYPTTGSGIIAIDTADASLVRSEMRMEMTLSQTRSAQTSKKPQKFNIQVVIVRR